MENKKKLDEVKLSAKESSAPVTNYFKMDIVGSTSDQIKALPGERVKVNIFKIAPLNEQAYIILELKR